MEAATGAAHVLVGKSRTALVDVEDFHLIAGHRWTFNGRYAYAKVEGGALLMHRLIIGASTGEIVDHRDGDGLNNRRSNLRICAHKENMRNRSRTCGSSRFKGVYRQGDIWRAQIGVDGKRIRLGNFVSETKAAKAYDAAALVHHGDFAKTNAQLGLY